ncbi:isocitrate lyase/phosphoenolpyruvate mutase family protein [Paenibacillus timonensis]|uniref:Isocitrate lyase/phosphoenolpyruvate mutase family protein n=1 Tax=Paenibacillus timonensis TaxID=225915 RepID=A0ABW3SF62_9BACL|nr:isocitrate lyase/phosphoenolpyruvate mutase family protein [Paenibacillus timonensis]MCH1641443.1 isocitrate lyase/phosphoenolpyruvate mutase family protein [Paenibacillus timonensis]
MPIRTKQIEQARALAELHVPGEPLVLFNVWDAGSALAMKEAGAEAIATGSWSVAAAHGYEDGEQLPFELVLANLERIVRAIPDLPVTIDIESGYGPSAVEVRKHVRQIVEAGAVGINIEDQQIGGEGLYAVEEQSRRIAAAREAAEDAGVPLFLNARCDVFFHTDSAEHGNTQMDEAIRRAHAYAEAGANGLFVPGLSDLRLIEALCQSSPLPVNIMVGGASSPSQRELAKAGVARVSYGPHPYLQMMTALKEAGRKALQKDH